MILEVDASTTGGGAACWFGARSLSQQEESPAHQATWEAFMALLAVRHFVTPRTRRRIVLVGDALGVWFGLIKMAAKSAKDNEIAKELAVHLAPLGHDLSGIHAWSEVNTTADALSRMAEARASATGTPKITEGGVGPSRAPSVDILEFVKKKREKNAERPRAYECPRTGGLRHVICSSDKMFGAVSAVCSSSRVVPQGWAHLGNGKVLPNQQTRQQGGFGTICPLRLEMIISRQIGRTVAAAQGPMRSRTPHRRLLKCFSSQEVREKMAKQGT